MEKIYNILASKIKFKMSPSTDCSLHKWQIY